jgi:hypothetical protein
MPVDQPIGTAVLYVSSNVEPDVLPAFNDWCDSVHHFDTMRIEGFLSLRRFELVEGAADGDTPEFRLLTLYQVAEPGDAAFDTPSYARHTASYAPPPPGVVDHITFERTVYERVRPGPTGTQPVGEFCVTLVGDDGRWLEDAAGLATMLPGVLNAHRVANDARGALLVDVADVDAGRAVLAALGEVEHAGRRRSLQLFRQVFPPSGVLLRDRQVLTESGLAGPGAEPAANSDPAGANTNPALTVEALLAREEIGDVIKRLARGTDRLDEELMASCYHADGFDDHNAFRGSGTEFARWVLSALGHFQATTHFTGSPLIRLDGDTAHVDTYCVAHHLTDRSDMIMGLRYVDRFERRDGRWLIARRVCAFDWTYTVAIDDTTRWRFAEDFTVGARDRTDITYRGV